MGAVTMRTLAFLRQGVPPAQIPTGTIQAPYDYTKLPVGDAGIYLNNLNPIWQSGLTGTKTPTARTNPGAPTSQPTSSTQAQTNWGNLTDPATWMGVVNDDAKRREWVRQQAPGLFASNPGLLDYYTGKVKGQPGANAAEQAGSAGYWTSKIQSDPGYAGSAGATPGAGNVAVPRPGAPVPGATGPDRFPNTGTPGSDPLGVNFDPATQGIYGVSTIQASMAAARARARAGAGGRQSTILGGFAHAGAPSTRPATLIGRRY